MIFFINQWLSTYSSWRPTKQNIAQSGDPFNTFIVPQHRIWLRPKRKLLLHKSGSGHTCCKIDSGFWDNCNISIFKSRYIHSTLKFKHAMKNYRNYWIFLRALHLWNLKNLCTAEDSAFIFRQDNLIRILH